MKDTWIMNSMRMNGRLEIRRWCNLVKCTMTWPGENSVVSAIGDTLEEALNNLDDALMDDCAKEMQDSGSV